jgi:hypothetical protein
MKPDRSNYEIWFTDWLDGNLNEQQAGELRVFLSENPDLEEELNGLAMVYLVPTDLIYSRKKDIERSPENLSESQFDQLCIACLENDITPGQKAELNEIISHNESGRKSFELIQKLRLKPEAGSFGRKSIVKKLTISQKIFRLSVVVLSAAATIALVVSIFMLVRENSVGEIPQIAQNSENDTLIIKSRQAIVYREEQPPAAITVIDTHTIKPIPEISSGELADQITGPDYQEPVDPVTLFQRAESPGKLKIEVPRDILMADGNEYGALRKYDPGYVPPLIEYRSNVQLFLARLFHEKIMKNNNAGTRPVESFEIAQAGITGLNKLFGWEIALQKNTDENGDARSYNFSSRLLKFNAPVKKPVKPL